MIDSRAPNSMRVWQIESPNTEREHAGSSSGDAAVVRVNALDAWLWNGAVGTPGSATGAAGTIIARDFRTADEGARAAAHIG